MSQKPNQKISNISFHKANAFLSKPFTFARNRNTKRLVEQRNNDLIDQYERKKIAPSFDSICFIFYCPNK